MLVSLAAQGEPSRGRLAGLAGRALVRLAVPTPLCRRIHVSVQTGPSHEAWAGTRHGMCLGMGLVSWAQSLVAGLGEVADFREASGQTLFSSNITMTV